MDDGRRDPGDVQKRSWSWQAAIEPYKERQRPRPGSTYHLPRSPLFLSTHRIRTASSIKMHFAALSTALLAIVHNALAVPVDSKPALDITLSQVGNTNVKAAVKNTGTEDVTFVHLNFFGDSAPVEKADVYHNGMAPRLQC